MGQAAAKEVAHGPQYKTNVMFLCNHNSCRSQMADGWLRQLRGDAAAGVAVIAQPAQLQRRGSTGV